MCFWKKKSIVLSLKFVDDYPGITQTCSSIWPHLTSIDRHLNLYYVEQVDIHVLPGVLPESSLRACVFTYLTLYKFKFKS